MLVFGGAYGDTIPAERFVREFWHGGPARSSWTVLEHAKTLAHVGKLGKSVALTLKCMKLHGLISMCA